MIFTFTTFYQDGAFPCCLQFNKTGELYGVAEQGGSNHFGVVYKLKPPSTPRSAWTETVLHSFGGSAVYPNGLLAGAGGALYGTTSGAYPANKYGFGTVFQWTP